MSDFDEKLRKALAEGEPLDAQRSAELQSSIRKEVASRHDKVIMRWVISEAVMMPLFGLWMGLAFSRSGFPSVRYGVVAILFALGILVTRLWYWQMNNKLEVLQELKLLRVQILSPEEAAKAGNYLSGQSIGEEMRERKPWLPLARGVLAAATLLLFIVGYFLGNA